METKREKAMALFRQGYNCSQSVFAAYAEDYGIPQEQALRLAASFGGGMGRMRDTCGAFSGALLVLGLESGSVNGSDAAGKQQNYEAVQKFAQQFRAANGSLVCRDLLGLAVNSNIADPKPAERTEAYYQERPCLRIVGKTCEQLDAFLKNRHK